MFAAVESEVRSYCRGWPTVLTTAKDSWVTDIDEAPCTSTSSPVPGALNYGHNNAQLKTRATGVPGAATASCTRSTSRRPPSRTFLETIRPVDPAAPRSLDYKVQFPGPTGANSVESALKLARKVTGRESIISFTNAFHGMTLGALAVTGNSFEAGRRRNPAGARDPRCPTTTISAASSRTSSGSSGCWRTTAAA